MYPFSAFWQEKDIPEIQSLGLLHDELARKEKDQRQAVKKALTDILHCNVQNSECASSMEEILKEILKFLASSPAYALLINLEDLWMEVQPQNIPGTNSKENWRKKTIYSYEDFNEYNTILGILREVNRLRKGKEITYGNKHEQSK